MDLKKTAIANHNNSQNRHQTKIRSKKGDIILIKEAVNQGNCHSKMT